jgi:folate-binding protein YgfZ
MTADWVHFVRAQASTAGPLPGAGDASIVGALCDLAGYSLIAVTGADAESFLHAQLSSDVRALGRDRCQLSTYNSPKGRVLATLLLWRGADGFLLQAPAAIAEGLVKRLALFVLRAKVSIALTGERWICIGLAGEGAERVLTQADMVAPADDLGVAAVTGAAPGWVLRLPGKRWELVVEGAGHAIEIWQRLRKAGAVPAEESFWRWHGIRSGIADIVPQTQDQFVPQMLNYELLGAVSFTKGCYPGQEIVARTQYRGEIKRRTWLLHGGRPDLPAAGQAIFGTQSDQAAGTVLAAAPAPQGGFDALACMHTELAAAGELRLGSHAGAALTRLALPYVIPASR